MSEVRNEFVTSDQHFDHKNIISYCNRPFENVQEMNAMLVTAWNSVVRPGDVVYHLGDFTLGGPEYAFRFFIQLNGFIKILADDEHHDQRWLKKKRYWTRCGDVEYLNAYHVHYSHGIPFVMFHYPIENWDRKHYGSFHLHGHSHGNTNSDNLRRFDVGVDNNNFTPVLLFDVIALKGGIEYGDTSGSSTLRRKR